MKYIELEEPVYVVLSGTEFSVGQIIQTKMLCVEEDEGCQDLWPMIWVDGCLSPAYVMENYYSSFSLEELLKEESILNIAEELKIHKRS